MRWGVLGGTFDPIHFGHLRLAGECLETLSLDKVLFAPAGEPWLKAGQPVTAGAHRLRMVELAVADYPQFGVLDWEVARPGPSYTVDTLARLRGEQGVDLEIYFILGVDALADFPRWKEPDRVLELARLAVVQRPGYGALVAAEVVAAVKARYGGYGERIELLTVAGLDISATDLRRRAARGWSLRYRTPAAVGGYVREWGLYG